MRVCVLDLGTNTFNILIADPAPSGSAIIPVYKEECPVKLGRSGINKKMITPDAISRGLKVISYFNDIITRHQVDQTMALATSAIRSSRNGSMFTDAITDSFHIETKIISGEREAELIFRGVKMAVPDTFLRNSLVLDIGGGSLEFIVTESGSPSRRMSIDIGTARILDLVRPDDTIAPVQISNIEQVLQEHLHPLLNMPGTDHISHMVGSAGAFDTFRDLLAGTGPDRGLPLPYSIIPGHAFRKLSGKLIRSSHCERLKMDGMPEFRAEMIVIAAIIVNFVLRKLNIDHIIQSDFALMEGAAVEMIEVSHPQKSSYGKNTGH